MFLFVACFQFQMITVLASRWEPTLVQIVCVQDAPSIPCGNELRTYKVGVCMKSFLQKDHFQRQSTHLGGTRKSCMIFRVCLFEGVWCTEWNFWLFTRGEDHMKVAVFSSSLLSPSSPPSSHRVFIWTEADNLNLVLILITLICCFH